MILTTKIRFNLSPVLLLIIICFVAHAQAATAPGVPKIDVPPTKAPTDGKGLSNSAREGVAPNCADPAAVRIDVKLLSRSSSTEGDFRIEGIVRNLGRVRFAPTDSYRVNLTEVQSGGRNRVIASNTFRNLNPGQEVKVIYEKVHLSVSYPEIYPSYRLEIVGGPDDTFDCRTNNNRLTRDGNEIRGSVVELLR